LSSWALLTVALSVNLYRLHLPRVWTVGALLLRCAKDFPFGKTDRELAPFFLSLSVRLPERCSSPRLNWALLLSPRRALLLDGAHLLDGAPLQGILSSAHTLYLPWCPSPALPTAPWRPSPALPTAPGYPTAPGARRALSSSQCNLRQSRPRSPSSRRVILVVASRRGRWQRHRAGPQSVAVGRCCSDDRRR
jgi:hypothetical protein